MGRNALHMSGREEMPMLPEWAVATDEKVGLAIALALAILALAYSLLV